jgi:uncharacterized heparinase superfamily protein
MSSAEAPVFPLALMPEMARAAWRRAGTPIRSIIRGNWFYSLLLSGPTPDRVLFHPYDALPRQLEDADALLRGRFQFESRLVDIQSGSVFDLRQPSEAWLRALHGFAWLPPLAMAGGVLARTLAVDLITQWIKRNRYYTEPAWLPEVMARRLINVLAHSRFILTGSVAEFRGRFFVSLREQSRMLSRIVGETTDGLPRFEAAAALALSGACLADSQRRLEEGLAHLQTEIARQIFNDGGYIDRAPESALHAYRYLTMVIDALNATRHPIPEALENAHARLAPALRFFRHGDGALSVFNGGLESDARMISALLSRDEVRGLPRLHAPDSGYQRLVAGRSFALMDCGQPPQSVYSDAAHASCLGFEFSAGTHRIVVNCGSAPVHRGSWAEALRTTAAHSALTVQDTSSAAILGLGIARELLGPRLLDGPQHVETKRTQTAHGWEVIGRHDAYVPQFGITHERQLSLSPQGLVLTGSDRLFPKTSRKRESHSFGIRFHIHPDIRMSPSQGNGIILKLPNGEGWRFRSSGGQPTIEESIYVGGGQARKCEQLVIAGIVKEQPIITDWLFEQINA